MKKIFKPIIYFYIGIVGLTLIYQGRVRLSQCAGVSACGASLAKGAVWSGAWPAYWSVYTYGRIFVAPASIPMVDAEWYLSQYPDVRAAIEAGKFKSALEHYLNNGMREGRLPGKPKFDEEFYLRSNADVADAVRKGQFKSGYEHYLLYGHLEGRKPVP